MHRKAAALDGATQELAALIDAGQIRPARRVVAALGGFEALLEMVKNINLYWLVLNEHPEILLYTRIRKSPYYYASRRHGVTLTSSAGSSICGLPACKP